MIFLKFYIINVSHILEMIHSGRIFHFIEFLDFILLFDNFENSINFVVVKQQENVVFLTMHSVGVVN